jgi:uncharacterized membrane protein
MAILNASPQPVSIADAANLFAIGMGALLVVAALTRRTRAGSLLAASSSAPFFYRGLMGRWPAVSGPADEQTKTALRGGRGVNVHEAVSVQRPVAEVYSYWRRLENLPRFMSHLQRVTETSDRHSSWVARLAPGLVVKWDAEVINEVENQVIGWRSLPGSDIVSAGSVTFRSMRAGLGTQVNVRLQYESAADGPGARLASFLGLEPSHVIREDLRRFKQLMETGEIARASAAS